MANRMPSMLALLGVLAVAGYQNRDKIGDMLKQVQNRAPAGPDGQKPEGLAGVLGGLGDMFGLSEPGGQPGGLSKGLGDLMDTFRGSDQREIADSWVNMDVPTRGITPEQVATSVGEDNITELTRRTGLSRTELLQRLATAIPETVDRATPNGTLPSSDDELRDRLSKPA